MKTLFTTAMVAVICEKDFSQNVYNQANNNHSLSPEYGCYALNYSTLFYKFQEEIK